MSEYGFGYDDTDETSGLGETGDQTPQGPKWFREGLSKLSSQVQELKAENDRLKQQQQRSQLEDTLKAKGYAPQAAGLFSGDPAKLDEWLTANGDALAKLPAAPGEESGHAPSGPPPTTVPADGQEQMRLMQEQGTQGVAPPQGSDVELAAALKAASPEAFAQLMQSNGSQFDWSGYTAS